MWSYFNAVFNVFNKDFSYILLCLEAQLWANVLFSGLCGCGDWISSTAVNSAQTYATFRFKQKKKNPCHKGGGRRKTAPVRDLSSEITRSMRSIRTRWSGAVPCVMIKPMELCSALRRELDWPCLREKGVFFSPNHICA